jgi:hypothetical protein
VFSGYILINDLNIVIGRSPKEEGVTCKIKRLALERPFYDYQFRHKMLEYLRKSRFEIMTEENDMSRHRYRDFGFAITNEITEQL